MADRPAESAPQTRRSRTFVLGYGLAQTGAFVSFIPLLTLLLPLKAEAVGGADKAVLLGQIAMLGGLTAALANFVFGALSDRTRTPIGRRRPWILGGLVLIGLALAAIAGATGPIALAGAVVLFQIAVNALFSPLAAVVPDMVPDRQKGLVSAFAGVALPAANLFTALVVARLTGSTGWAFGAVALATLVLILPFAATLREPAPDPGPTPPVRLSLAALKDRAFRTLFGSRLLVECAVAINTLYLLFLVQEGGSGAAASRSPTEVFGLLLLTSTLAATAAGLVGGVLSDRMGGRRSPFVIAGCVGMAAGLGLLVLWPTWPGALVAQLVFGAAHGLHASTVAALTAESLPWRRTAGRDLGVMNMAIALPQMLAPAAATVILVAGLTLPAVFGAAAVAAGLAGLLLLPLGRTTFNRAKSS